MPYLLSAVRAVVSAGSSDTQPDTRSERRLTFRDGRLKDMESSGTEKNSTLRLKIDSHRMNLHLDYNLDEFRTGSRGVTLPRTMDLDLLDRSARATTRSLEVR
jgi:hypothetical protein